MTMKNLNKTILAFALLLVVNFAKAQEVSPLDFMMMNPYQMKSNPAFDMPYQSVFSILVGNVGMSLQNKGIHDDNCFDFDAQGRPVAYNFRKLANSLNESNYTSFTSNWNLFTLYRRLNKGVLTFSYDFRAQGAASYNDGLFMLLGYGNSAFLGEDDPAVVDMNLNLKAYQQIAVGYQLNITDKLSIGARLKFLLGLANVTTDAFHAAIYTDPDSYAIRIQENIGVRMSVPRALIAEDGKLKLNSDIGLGELFHNPGFGVDLGAEYHITDKIGVVASVTDLGFISWKYNNIQMTGKINDAGEYYDNGEFLFTGLNLNDMQGGSGVEHFLDTLKEYFKVDFSTAEKYTTGLNANVMLRGYYDINPQNRVSAQFTGKFMETGFRPAFTVAYSGSFFKMLDVCATYTIMKDSYANFGIGLGGNFDTFHIYVATSNIIGIFNPLNSKGFCAQAGIVFNLRGDD